MQPGVEPLRARHTGRDAADRDHRAARGAPARGALRRSGCPDRPAGGLVPEAKGEGVDPQGVQRGGQEGRVQEYRDASGRSAYRSRVDTRERIGHRGAEDSAEEGCAGI